MLTPLSNNAGRHSAPAADDVLITAENVSKKFCRALKKSLWYGVQDMVGELFARRRGSGSPAGNGTSPGGNGERQPPRAPSLRDQEFWAVNDVSFQLRRGECIGLIGRNGAGKTTLLKMLNGLIKPDAGRITVRGRVGALIALGAGFNPILSGRENIYVNASVLGLTRSETNEKIEEIIDFAGVEDFIDSPVQSYSSGMQVRLGFAVATALDPDVLILDEVLAVGDAAFRNKCYRRIVALRKTAAVIFVSHAMENVARICDKTLLLVNGRVEHHGGVPEGIAAYERVNEEGDDEQEGFVSVAPPIREFSSRLSRDNIRCGDPLQIKIHVSSEQSLPSFILRISFYSASGAFAADANVQGGEHGIQVEAGDMDWEVNLNSVPLRNGKYRITLNIIDPHGDLVVWSHKMNAIEVSGAYPGANADCQLQLSSWRSNSSPAPLLIS